MLNDSRAKIDTTIKKLYFLQNFSPKLNLELRFEMKSLST